MKPVATGKKWLVLPTALFAGFALGCVDPQFGRCVQQFGLRPGLATATSVNLILPLLAVLLAVSYPQLTTALLNAVSLAGGFLQGLAAAYPSPQPWTVLTLLQSIPPVLVLACVGYRVLSGLAVLLTWAVRELVG